MFKILCCLLFSAVWAMESDTEIYSDTAPTGKFIITKNLGNIKPTDYDVVTELFAKKNYRGYAQHDFIYNKDEPLTYKRCGSKFHVFLNTENKNAFFVQLNHKKNIDSLEFPAVVLSRTRYRSWNPPIMREAYIGLDTDAVTMSWKFISSLLQSHFQYWEERPDFEPIIKLNSPFYDALFEEIRKRGLNNVVTRAAFIINVDWKNVGVPSTLQVFSIGDNEDEHLKNKEKLESLFREPSFFEKILECF